MRGAMLGIIMMAGITPGGGAPGALRGPLPATGVTVIPAVLEFRSIGETRQLFATVTPGKAVDQHVTWESSDPRVASVDKNGLVTARSLGTAAITVVTRAGHFKAVVRLEVGSHSRVGQEEGPGVRGGGEW